MGWATPLFDTGEPPRPTPGYTFDKAIFLEFAEQGNHPELLLPRSSVWTVAPVQSTQSEDLRLPNPLAPWTAIWMTSQEIQHETLRFRTDIATAAFEVVHS